jgi:hypothetical protein
MTGPSTDPAFFRELERLSTEADHCYLRSGGIVERIEHGGRTFYSKFQRLDTPPNEILLRQHLRRELTLAIPLLREGRGDRLFIDYVGEEPERFLQTLLHLFAHLGISRYRFYQGERPHRRSVLLFLEPQSLEELHRLGSRISDMLETRLTKSWRILPDRRLPEPYNIFPLPYGYIN